MRQFILAVVCIVVGCASSWADDMQEYKEFINEVRAEVYARDMPAFEVREVPEKYNDESAVILAIYEEIIAKKKTSFGFNSSVFGLGNNAKIHADRLTRMMVLINDKAALEQYSEFDFSIRDKEQHYGFKNEDTRKALGARIIKPDGSVVEVDTEDYVDVLQGKKGQEKRSKLAIPGLEVGDIIDIFVFTSQKLQNMHMDPMEFVLKDAYPILDYQIHCELDDDLTTMYRTLNGAPDFEQTVDDKKNYILDLRLKNIDEKNPRLYYNEFRQSPRILMHIFNRRANSYTYTPPSAKRDGVHANPAAWLIYDDMWDIGLVNNFISDWVTYGIKDGKKIKKELFKLHKDKKISDAELADYIYNLWVYDIFAGRFSSNDRSMISDLKKTFSEAKLQFGYGITTEITDEPIDSLISYRNATWCIFLNDGSRYYLPFRNILAPNEIPGFFQGEKCIPHLTRKEWIAHPDSSLTLPSSSAADNVRESLLKVAVDGSLLDIVFRGGETGMAKRRGSQLLNEEDIVNGYAKYLGKYGFEVAPKENDKKRMEREERYIDARKRQLDNAKQLMGFFHDSDIEEIKSFKIDKIGIDPADNTLLYTINYTVDNMVKRASANLVLPIGKLLGLDSELLESDKRRTDDVFFEVPITDRSTVEIVLPHGYKVSEKLVEALKCNIDNEAASFKVDASVRDGIVIVSSELVEKHKLEPVANWPKLVEIYEAEAAWAGKTLMLEK